MNKLDMDTRYPPAPEQVVVPLYPSRLLPQSEGNAASESVLNGALHASFLCDDESLTIGDSASSLLRAYLLHGGNPAETQRVGLPMFSCQSLVDAVIDSGSIPVFYDIDSSTSVTEEAVSYVIGQRCRTCIWPVFFGSRDRDNGLIESLHKSGVDIVFDEAQANPFSEVSERLRHTLEPRDVALYSFGASKLLTSCGGGAMFGDAGNIGPVRKVVEAEELRHNPKVSHRQAHARYTTQDTLLENREHAGSPFYRIDGATAAFTLGQLRKYTQLKSQHDDRYQLLREAIANSRGEQALGYIENVSDTPINLAIKVDPADRYNFMAELAGKNLETTWWYYPINRVSRYSNYPAQRDESSSKIAESIVILPFQWQHSDSQVDKLVSAILATKDCL